VGGSDEAAGEPDGGGSDHDRADRPVSESVGEPIVAADDAARVAALEALAAAAGRELEAARARVGELEAGSEAQAGELARTREAVMAVEQRALAAHRRALLAENRGQVVDELVQGGTVEALEASVELARAAYGRVAEQARALAAAERVPGGGGSRGESDVERLSPLAKIARGLTK